MEENGYGMYLLTGCKLLFIICDLLIFFHPFSKLFILKVMTRHLSFLEILCDL